MTNHSEAAGPVEPDEPMRVGEPIAPEKAMSVGDPVALDAPTHTGDPLDEPMVTLRTPAELADALPYLLGFKPEESIVLIALHGERGRFGGRVRLGIPERAEDWSCVADQLAQCLVSGCERRGDRPDGIVAFLCREPGAGDSGQQVVEHLRPLAQLLRTACGALEVPVFEVVCISDGRFWTYCCPDTRCCPPEGIPLLRPGTSVLAAASTYMGVRVDATQSQIRGRLAPWVTGGAVEQERALDAAGLALIPRMLNEEGHETAEETLDLARRIMGRLADAPPVSGTSAEDGRDDGLIAHDEAAALIIGLQVRTTRDHAAAWMEGDAAPAALRLWRALARRCVGAYAEHAAAPLSLAGWVAWSLGDLVEGQEALDMALCADPEYMFALLLHRACNEGLDPEAIRRCLRSKDDGGTSQAGASQRPGKPDDESTDDDSPPRAPAESGATRRRRRRRLPRSAGTADSAPRGNTRPSSGPGQAQQNRWRMVRRDARNGR
ncbi:DUF4192 domain-containing protein [Streptomyces sp. DSM 118878]